MIKLLTRPVVWPVKASAYSLVAGYKTGRLVGFRRLTVFGLGVGVGLLVAPVPGRDLRGQLTERLGLNIGPNRATPLLAATSTPTPTGPSSSVAVPATEGGPGGSSSGGVSGATP